MSFIGGQRSIQHARIQNFFRGMGFQLCTNYICELCVWLAPHMHGFGNRLNLNYTTVWETNQVFSRSNKSVICNVCLQRELEKRILLPSIALCDLFWVPRDLCILRQRYFLSGPTDPLSVYRCIFRPTLLVYKGYEDCQGEGVRLNPPPPFEPIYFPAKWKSTTSSSGNLTNRPD